jgi:hypothetical protein
VAVGKDLDIFALGAISLNCIYAPNCRENLLSLLLLCHHSYVISLIFIIIIILYIIIITNLIELSLLL